MSVPAYSTLSSYFDLLARGRRRQSGRWTATPVELRIVNVNATAAWIALLDLGLQAAAALHEDGYHYPALASDLRSALRRQP